MPVHQVRRPREQVIAARVLGVFVLLSALVVALVLLATADRGAPDALGSAGSGDAADVGHAAGRTAEGDGTGGEDATTGSDDDDQSGETVDDQARGDDPASDDAPGADTSAGDDHDGDGAGDAEPIRVDFDGACSAELSPDELAERPRLRPWQFPQCRWAPIALDESESWWIVVLESLSGDDFDADEAGVRAADLGRSDQVLWSSHYPSLNPDLWVVFVGPFRDEESAAAAAGRQGGGAYPRILSDEEGDRYCVAADGCVGETRD